MSAFTKVTGALSRGNEYAAVAIRATAANALTQGIAVTTGLQSAFNWRDVAITAVSAPVAQAVEGAAGRAFGDGAVGALAARTVAGASGALVRRAFGGTVDTANALIDAFGNAIGNSIVDGMQPTSAGELTPHERRMRGEDSNRSGVSGGGGSQWVPPEPVIESPLDNNPDFFANLPMPTAEFETDMLGEQESICRRKAC